MAAQLRIPDPLITTDNIAENWTKFKEDFNDYILAGGYNEKHEDVKIALFRNLIGHDGKELLKTFSKGATLNTLDKILDVYDTNCVVQVNVIFERHCFYTRNQAENEKFDVFYNDVKKLARTCDFGDKENEMVRDRLIFGVQNQTLQEKLIEKGAQDLSKTVEACRTWERSKTHTEEIQNSKEIHHIKTQGTKSKSSSYNKYNKKSQNKSFKTNLENSNLKNEVDIIKCRKCNESHDFKNCPAFGYKCKRCGSYNHFTKCCRSKQVDCINDEDDSDKCLDSVNFNRINISQIEKSNVLNNIKSNDINTDFFIEMIQNSKSTKNGWFQEILIEKFSVNFKLDSGSDVNILPYKLFQKLNKSNMKLIDCNANLKAYGGFLLKPCGMVKLLIELPDELSTEDWFMILDCDTVPILGRDACSNLNLIKRVYNISDEKEAFISENKHLFEGLGKFPQQLELVLRENAVPIAKPPRRIPLAIKDKVKEALNKLTLLNIIEPVNEPAEWVSNLVVVEKPNGDIRLCLDPKYLNETIVQNHYMIPTLDDLRAKLSGVKFFSVLDLKDGFYQIELTKKSSKYCTFSSPFGNYRFKRLPFGINVAPEEFQRRNELNFGDIPGTFVYIDDVMITGKTSQEHDDNLKKIIERAEDRNIKFNLSKLQYKVSEVSYLGHIFNSNGCKTDPKRIKAISEMTEPSSKIELQRYLGMVNYLRSFIPNMSQITQPLRELLKSKIEFQWNKNHSSVIAQLKNMLSQAPLLQSFDMAKKIIIQTDASKSGVGCVLLQNKKPVAYASRSLTSAEENYAQVEKELLAILFSCIKFHSYIYGRKVIVHTDHKPLVSIMKNEMSKVNSSRLQRMKMKMLIYDLEVIYVPGKDMHIADHLSRSYLKEECAKEFDEYNEVVHTVNVSLEKQEEFRKQTENDDVLKMLKDTFHNGWPYNRDKVPDPIRVFWKHKNDIYCDNDILFLGDRIIVPRSMRKAMMNKLHEAHLGMSKTKERARQILYWPNMDVDIEEFISKCRTCEKFQTSNIKQHLIPHEVPEYPFEQVGCDIMSYAGEDYLVLMDYYSKWLECRQLKSKRSGEVIKILKEVFSTHGIPKKLFSDNMPFASQEFVLFSREWEFQIVTSSPTYPKSNGESEKAVDIAKRLLKKAYDDKKDFSYALLEYRNHLITGLQASPSQILFSRITRTKIPIKQTLLDPKIQSKQSIINNSNIKQAKAKKYHDRNARHRHEFEIGQSVVYRKNKIWEPAIIIEKHSNPRSYIIKTNTNQIIRRNEIHLKKSKNKCNLESTFPSYLYENHNQQRNISINGDEAQPHNDFNDNNQNKNDEILTTSRENVQINLDNSTSSTSSSSHSDNSESELYESINENTDPGSNENNCYINQSTPSNSVETTRFGRKIQRPVKLNDYDLSTS